MTSQGGDHPQAHPQRVTSRSRQRNGQPSVRPPVRTGPVPRAGWTCRLQDTARAGRRACRASRPGLLSQEFTGSLYGIRSAAGPPGPGLSPPLLLRRGGPGGPDRVFHLDLPLGPLPTVHATGTRMKHVPPRPLEHPRPASPRNAPSPDWKRNHPAGCPAVAYPSGVDRGVPGPERRRRLFP